MKRMAWALVATAILLFVANGTRAVSLRIETHRDGEGEGDSVVLIRDSTRVVLPHGAGNIDSDVLNRIPPEAWAKMSPDQIENIVDKALAAEADESPWGARGIGQKPLIIPIVGMAGAFLMPIVIVALVLMSKRRTAQQHHEQRMAMIERGIVDPTLFAQPAEARPAPVRSRKMWIWGIVLAFAGFGLLVGEILEDGFGDIGGELMIMLVGIGLIIAARVVDTNRNRRDEHSDVPPQTPASL